MNSVDLDELVALRVAELRRLNVSEIEGLPPHRTESLEGDVPTTISVYHDVSEGDEHLIVVQATRDRWGGLSTLIAVNGFVVTTTGEPRSLTEKEKWNYL